MSTIVIWIDPEVDNIENSEYTDELRKNSFHLETYKNIDDAIRYMKNIYFPETKVVIAGKLFDEFIKSFKEKTKEMNIAPKFIVFTKNKERFLRISEEYENENNTFFKYGGIATKFKEIQEFLLKENFKPKNMRMEEEIQLTFDYIDTKEKLILPLFFKALIDKPVNNSIEGFIKLLYEYYNVKDKVKNKNFLSFLSTIKSIQDIPKEILAKYFARLYTIESDFYGDINRDLGTNKIEKYIPFIKILYEGVKLEALGLASDKFLYRGSKIAKEEIENIKTFLKNKKGEEKSIVFSKSFLSFSKDKDIAKKFLEKKNTNEKLSKVFLKVQKDNDIGYNLSTHADIEKISIYPKEREVLFFPFSSFEIQDVKEVNMNNEQVYEIELLYLGKYLKDLENDKSLSLNENKLPDSKFKTQLKNSGLVEKEKIENVDIKTVNNDFKKYEKEIKENEMKNNFITGEIYINDYDVNQEIPIINSFENVKRINKFKKRKDDWIYENEKELQENVEIRINGKKIKFSYTHKFDKEGKYQIEYFFKNMLTKTNHMFYQCLRLIKLNLLNFNTKNVTNMSYMFYYCNLIPKLDLSGFDTKNVRYMNFMFGGCSSVRSIEISKFNTGKVINMRGIFWNCNSLINLDLSSFITQNVVDMSSMFNGCKLLKNLYLSHFDTKNVINMNSMFDGCEYLTDLNLSNFNTEKVENMSCMFFNCIKLENLDLSKFNTKNVYSMKNMFFCCNSLTNLDLSNFDTNNVNDMNCMFYECNSLVSLNLKNFKTINVNDMNNIFDCCISLNKESIITDDRQILKRLRSTY